MGDFGKGTHEWEPSDWIDPETKEFYTQEALASGFGLDAGEFGKYFPVSSAYKIDKAETDYGLAVEGAAAERELTTELYNTKSDRLLERGEESILSLAQGVGGTYSEAATAYSDATAQGIGQQTSFTSGASGRSRKKAFSRTQDTMAQQVAKSNLGFTERTRNLAEETDSLDAQFLFDVGDPDDPDDMGAIGRDRRSAAATRDYLVSSATAEFEQNIYDSLLDLHELDAWGLDAAAAEKEYEDEYGKKTGKRTKNLFNPSKWWMGDNPGPG